MSLFVHNQPVQHKTYKTYNEVVEDGKKIIQLKKDNENSIDIINKTSQKIEESKEKIKKLELEKENNNVKLNNNKIIIINNNEKINKIEENINKNNEKISGNNKDLDRLAKMKELLLKKKQNNK